MRRDDVPFMRRPRTLVVALAATLLLFGYLVHVTHREDEEAVWIWMGMRSDGRCGRDYGTEHVPATKCGRGSPCCSSHGWCGASEEYCSPSLGCQSGCWDEEHPRERELRTGAMTPQRADVDADDWDDGSERNGSDPEWDGAYDEDYDGDDPEYGEYDGPYPGYHGRRHAAYGDGGDDGDDDYDGGYGGYGGYGEDPYGEYVDAPDAGLYDGGGEPFDPVEAQGGDPEELTDPGHNWGADELLFHAEGEGGEGAEAEGAEGARGEHPEELTDVS